MSLKNIIELFINEKDTFKCPFLCCKILSLKYNTCAFYFLGV